MLTTVQAERAYTLQFIKRHIQDASNAHGCARSTLRNKSDSKWADQMDDYPATLEWELEAQRDIEALRRVQIMVETEMRMAVSQDGPSDPSVSVL